MTPAATPGDASPARPYAGEAVLELMRASRRPGGVPDELMTAQISQAVADQLWTWSGDPWAQVAIGGTCGPEACTLEIAGTPADTDDSDLYTLEVDPASAVVTLKDADLHGLPADLWVELDGIARSDMEADALAGLELAGVRWFPPPDQHQFALAYRSGGEEGSPKLDLVVDRSTETVVESRERGSGS